MKIRALGASGGISAGYKTTCYLINENILLDCGAAATGLSLEEQENITDILITHPHLDHIKDIAFVIDNTFDETRKKLNLHSSGDILNDVKNHLFNDKIWPDFNKIPALETDPNSVLLNYCPFNHSTKIGNIEVTQVEVNHPGNAVGFILDDGIDQVVFTGDTGCTEEIWELANDCDRLKALFTEISFPNSMEELALASGHFTTRMLGEELKKLKQNVPVYINHFKPQYFKQLVEEFHDSAPENWILLHQNHDIRL